MAYDLILLQSKIAIKQAEWKNNIWSLIYKEIANILCSRTIINRLVYN